VSAGTRPARAWLSFRRIVDIPFATCVAALDSWQLTGHDGGRRASQHLVCGPAEHDRDNGTRRVPVRLGPRPAAPAAAAGVRPLVLLTATDRCGTHPLRARPAQRRLPMPSVRPRRPRRGWRGDLEVGSGVLLATFDPFGREPATKKGNTWGLWNPGHPARQPGRRHTRDPKQDHNRLPRLQRPLPALA
jgi:hypothetical protein